MTAAISNACGGCTACCTIMRVEMVPPKPARETCVHCVKGGCAIYDARPSVCREWSCVWLLTQEDAVRRLPSALRPDRSGVVLEINSKGYLVAHCETPAAWKRDPMRRWLIARTRNTKVLIDVGEDQIELLAGDGSSQRLQFVGVDPATNERIYRRDKGVRP